MGLAAAVAMAVAVVLLDQAAGVVVTQVVGVAPALEDHAAEPPPPRHRCRQHHRHRRHLHLLHLLPRRRCWMMTVTTLATKRLLDTAHRVKKVAPGRPPLAVAVGCGAGLAGGLRRPPRRPLNPTQPAPRPRLLLLLLLLRRRRRSLCRGVAADVAAPAQQSILLAWSALRVSRL